MPLKLLQGVAARFPFASIEITLEANPGTVEAGRFCRLSSKPVSPIIGIGVQVSSRKNCRIGPSDPLASSCG